MINFFNYFHFRKFDIFSQLSKQIDLEKTDFKFNKYIKLIIVLINFTSRN